MSTCYAWSSIVYTRMDLVNFCAAKNGTFGTLQMLLTQEVDVIFGPLCSSGRRHAAYKMHYNTQFTSSDTFRNYCQLFMPSPHRVGHYAMMTVVCPSVCLSVPCLTLSREQKGIAS